MPTEGVSVTEGRFVKVPLGIMARTDLFPSDKMIWAMIADHQGGNGRAWPGLRRLAAECGLTRPTVVRAVRHLERLGLLHVERPEIAGGRNTSVYSVISPLEVKPLDRKDARGDESVVKPLDRSSPFTSEVKPLALRGKAACPERERDLPITRPINQTHQPDQVKDPSRPPLESPSEPIDDPIPEAPPPGEELIPEDYPVDESESPPPAAGRGTPDRPAGDDILRSGIPVKKNVGGEERDPPMPPPGAGVPRPGAGAGQVGTNGFRRARQAVTADVLAIYQAYPRHVGRAAAVKAIQRALLELSRRGQADPIAWLTARVQVYAASPAGQRGKFTPHPSTWFNQCRFDDDHSEWSDRETKPKAAPKPIPHDWHRPWDRPKRGQA